MGNCLTLNSVSKRSKAMPIETTFKLPSPIPSWPPGNGFGSGVIDLGGGLQVCQITSFNKIWAAYEGGPSNNGATFFEPSQIPEGFSVLGHYSQPNDRLLHGWVLVGREETNGGGALEKPVDYTLVWSSESLKIKQDGIGYIWLPTPPNGYKAVGHLVTTTADKPSLDSIRCVRSNLTDDCQADTWIWGPGETSDPNGLNIFSLRPTVRGIQATGVSVGCYGASTSSASNSDLACLKNVNSTFSCMPNLNQVQAIFMAYSPWINFHPDEDYLPSSVTWYFTNGALLYKKGDESNPVPIAPTGSNLPQGDSNDGTYWIDLPVDEAAKERVMKGDLGDSQVYLHVKPMLGGTFTDIAIWIFYPFNGPAKAKVELVNVSLGMIGEHVGDWEHLTLRVSNFSGELWSVYFSQHSGGSWVQASELEFLNGNKPVTYSSLHGHAMYSKAGLVLQGGGGIGIRNDTAKSKMVMDTGTGFSVVAAEYLVQEVVEPPWINYFREWGPKITYDIEGEIKKVEKVLPGKLKSAFEKFVRSLPSELLGEEGPTGPKVKGNWAGDEK